jgi:hypothetical protein
VSLSTRLMSGRISANGRQSSRELRRSITQEDNLSLSTPPLNGVSSSDSLPPLMLTPNINTPRDGRTSSSAKSPSTFEMEDEDEDGGPSPAVRRRTRRGSSFTRQRRGSSFLSKMSPKNPPKTPEREFDDGMFIPNLDITDEGDDGDEDMDGELLRVKAKKLPKEFKAGGLPPSPGNSAAAFDDETNAQMTKAQRQKAKVEAHKAEIRATKEAKQKAAERESAMAAKEEALEGVGASGCCGRMKRKGPSAKKKRAIEIADSTKEDNEFE